MLRFFPLGRSVEIKTHLAISIDSFKAHASDGIETYEKLWIKHL